MTEKERPPGISNLTQRLASNPASRAFVPLADEYLRQNLLEDAILVLTRGTQHHPTYVAAHMMLGNAYQRAGRITEARRAFEEVLRIHPENVLAYKKLAILYRDAGQLGETVEICNKVLRMDPYDKQAKGLLAAAQEEISAVEDGGAVVTDWPGISLQTPPPQSDEVLSLPSLEEIEQEEVEIIESVPDEVQVADDAFEQAVVALAPCLTSEEVPKAVPLAFVAETAYNPPSLYQIRLKEWLVSMEAKGVRR